MSKEGLGLEITELTLAPPGRGQSLGEKNEKKRGFWEVEAKGGELGGGGDGGGEGKKAVLPSAKSQVVGWPPVCSYRKKNSFSEKDDAEASKMYVKVSMDGAVYLRKIDLGLQKGYRDLAMALEKLFGCYGIADQASTEGDVGEYMLIYEDKDGDWMLAGDVPWEMFMETCKRLRIMKRSEAMDIGLQPRDFLKGNLKDNS